MDITYTSHLFYKKFPYKIKLVRQGNVNSTSWNAGWTPQKCLKWLNNENINYKSKSRIKRSKKTGKITVTTSIFLENTVDYNRCQNKWKKYIVLVTVPYNQNHENLLKNNEKLSIRKRLIYGKYRYIIKFKWSRFLINDGALLTWIKENVANEDYNCSIKCKIKGWSPRIYTNDLSYLTLLKLTWGEHISETVVVQTFDEIEKINII